MSEKIIAVLGPTNTGKTFFAVQEMLKYQNGIIGFPLRLLARENYESVGKEIGKSKVALITGEEKIIPKTAKYFFCTVESMPSETSFEFLAIDEIQLASNPERGYLFTEKLINFKGSKKTLFLGSNSILNILKKVFPKIIIYQRPRLSELNYYGYKNLSRIPPRSAIIAFSQIEVYEIAEKLKKFKGGVSVVTGALSPEARNAQVSIFENQEVDYIVATDAIGLGLNLQIKYVFFTSLVKFDGVRKRYLTYDEVAQIAGRAGRYINNGYFGITQNLKAMNEELISFVQNYKYNEIEKIFWRNSDLNFNSIGELLKSIKKKPKVNYLILKKNAPDFNYLNILISDQNLQKKINNKNDVRLLWDICRVPDYTKSLDEFHSALLTKIANFLLEKKLVPEKWVEIELKKIRSVTENISIINLKLTQIRTWSYISNKNFWMENSEVNKKKIKKIENFLSNRLHSCLIQKFVDDSIRNPRKFISSSKTELVTINKKKDLLINNKKIGFVRGLYFIFIDENYLRNKKSYNYKNIKNSIKLISERIVEEFVNTKFSDFCFDVEGRIFWKNSLVASFGKANNIISPNIRIIADDNFSKKERHSLIFKLQKYTNFYIKKNFHFLLKINTLLELKSSSSNLRAVCFSLYENLGFSEKEHIASYYKKLDKDELKTLQKIGLECGCRFFYFKSINVHSLKLSQMLTNIFFGLGIKSFFLKRLFLIQKKTILKKVFLNKYSLKLGYVKIKVAKSEYYLDYFLFEKLIKDIYFCRKRKISFNMKTVHECENNLFFLNKCFSNPRLLNY